MGFNSFSPKLAAGQEPLEDPELPEDPDVEEVLAVIDDQQLGDEYEFTDEDKKYEKERRDYDIKLSKYLK